MKKSPENVTIYRNVGSLLIKASDKAVIQKEVVDDKETLEVRIKTLDRQEKSLREKYQTMQEQLNKALGAASAASPDKEN